MVAALYPNGFIPYEKLTIFARGKYSDGREWVHALSPATYQRHLNLVARAKARTGKTLALGDGSSAYRDYAEQVRARAIYGNGAARPGTSSHGGYWEGMNTLAMDYANWAYVYGGDNSTTRSQFGADCEVVGLSPFLISPARGYPDEPWHVIDKSPWAGPAGGDSTPFPIPPTRKKAPTMTLLLGPDNNSGGKDILVVSGPGLWERWGNSTANLTSLKSQYGDPVNLSGNLAAMTDKYSEAMTLVNTLHQAIDDAVATIKTTSAAEIDAALKDNFDAVISAIKAIPAPGGLPPAADGPQTIVLSGTITPQ